MRLMCENRGEQLIPLVSSELDGEQFEDCFRRWVGKNLIKSGYRAWTYDVAQQTKKDHGLVEMRHCWTLTEMALLP